MRYAADPNPEIVHIVKRREWVILVTQCGKEWNVPEYSAIPGGAKVCEECASIEAGHEELDPGRFPGPFGSVIGAIIGNVSIPLSCICPAGSTECRCGHRELGDARKEKEGAR
jgi:hypothetical protein